MPNPDVKILKVESLYEGYSKIDRYQIQTKLFAGGWSQPYDRELIRRKEVAAALLYDPVLDAVVMIEQFRIGAFVAPKAHSAWQIEIVAGVKEPNETIEKLLYREVLEETGLKIKNHCRIYHYLASPGVSDEEVTIFWAEVDAKNVAQFSGLATENEDICVHVVPCSEALVWLDNGKIQNAITLIALQWLALNRPKLRASSVISSIAPS